MSIEPTDDELRAIARKASTGGIYSGGVKALRAVWEAASRRKPSDVEIEAAAKAMIETHLVPAWWWATDRGAVAVARDVARAALSAHNTRETQ